jgi:hypothetical protein
VDDADVQRLLTEVATLNARMAELRAYHVPRHLWARVFIRDLATNPHAQYKVHLCGVLYWLANFPLVIALFAFAQGVWLSWGIFITLIYSLYANLMTDYGAMSAAMAAYGTPMPELPGEEHQPEEP